MRMRRRQVPAQQRPRALLIIEDNVDAADSCATCWPLDHEVEVAYNGRQACEGAGIPGPA